MMEFVFKIWYILIVLPFIIFLEGSKRFADFLKKKNIYAYWDVWHAYIVVFIILAIVLWANGFY